MKPVTKKIVSMLLIAVMLLAFAGCGKSKSGDKEQFLGTWKATLDMTDLLNESLREGIGDDEMADFFVIDKFSFDVVFKFNDDGTYSTDVDQASLDKSVETMKTAVKDGLMDYFEVMIDGQELDMSVEELLELSGLSMDDLLEEAMPADLFDDVVAEFKLKGNWKAENGKLYTTESLSDDVNKAGYELYEITNAGIKLSLVDESEDESGVFPMLLKKVN